MRGGGEVGGGMAVSALADKQEEEGDGYEGEDSLHGVEGIGFYLWGRISGEGGGWGGVAGGTGFEYNGHQCSGISYL